MAASLAGCTGQGGNPSVPLPEVPASGAEPAASWFDGLLDVGGRQLNAACWGTGGPAVLYLHGMIQPGDAASWAHAPEMRARLAPRTTYCEYERTNVGASTKQAGPIPVTESVADLNAVIRAIDLDTPVVLLGGSFGGLIAYTYAGTYPDDVAGVVLLDPTLPGELELELLLDEDMRMPGDAWTGTAEKIDVYGAYAAAERALPGLPEIPGTLFATEDLWAPDGLNAEAFRRGIRDDQQTLIDRFDPGETVTVDAPHAMISAVPDQIAESVLEIVESASG